MSTLKTILNTITSSTEQPPRVCKQCGTEIPYSKYIENSCICTECGAYFRMRAVERLDATVDKGSFQEIDRKLKSKNPIDFPEYAEKLEKAEKTSGLNEGVVCGTAKIDGMDCALFIMDSAFMMGSMGTVVGEKITRLFEKATSLGLPVIGFITSGGARMQEGIFSLMQMAKVSGAVKRHSEAGLLYIAVLTDPTTGGITASGGEPMLQLDFLTELFSLAKKEGITEQLKSSDQMKWVQMMNNLKNSAEEIVIQELIYA